MRALAERLGAVAGKARRGLAPAADFGELGITLNRLVMASLVLFAAGLEAPSGAEARRFLAEGLPGLQAYVVLAGVAQAHLLIWPERRFWRRILGVCGDSAIISYGLYIGSGASAFLYPLYLWMILGNGLRPGAVFMAAAVVSAATGFAAVIWFTPFWRQNTGLSTGLFLALVTMPAYGALLLRRVADARAEAERANRAKTLLLANVSHELRTPLTAILGLGDLLTRTRPRRRAAQNRPDHSPRRRRSAAPYRGASHRLARRDRRRGAASRDHRSLRPSGLAARHAGGRGGQQGRKAGLEH